jgi:hypothetical protein
MIALTSFGLGLAASAAAQDHPTRIACPQTWPGPEQTGSNLTYAAGWYQHHMELGPAVEGAETRAGPGDIHLDCAYGPGKDKSALRITVVVPGHPTYCGYLMDKAGAWTVFGCETNVSDEEQRSPTLWYVAEPIDRSTTLFGFGLDQSADTARSTAKQQGFVEEPVHTEANSLVFGRGDDRISVRFSPTHGRSREIVWTCPPTVEAAAKRADYVRRRFGYRTETVSGPTTWTPQTGATGTSKTVWPKATAPIRLEEPNELGEGYHLILDEP